MSEPATPPDLDALALSQIAMLKELAEMGMEMARITMTETKAAVQSGALPRDIRDFSLSLDRATRMVRRVIGLQKLIVEGHALKLKVAEAAEKAATQAAQRQADAAQYEREAHCNATRAAEAVDDLVYHLSGADYERRERLLSDLVDWVDTPDIDDARPIRVIVAEICQGLGIEPDWGFWDVEDWMDDPSPATPTTAFGGPPPPRSGGGPEGPD